MLEISTPADRPARRHSCRRAGPAAEGHGAPFCTRGRGAPQAHGPPHVRAQPDHLTDQVLSKLDIADRLRPQDGKARVRIKNLSYDLRVSTIPAAGAEKCVILVLDSNVSVTLEDLVIPEYELSRMRQLISNRDGVVVVTGPTSSGKTTTLYSALRELADGEMNIMTVEDPIEYDIPTITQIQVETKQGLTFAAALRPILRQDPDVILVGEIRDRETAETAVQAAMTGHLVLATVHANDAVSAIGRLADIGLQHATIGQTLRGAL